MDQLLDLVNNIEPYATTLLAIIGVASVIARITPTPVDDGVLAALKIAVNAIAFNSGPAENLEIPGDRGSIEEGKKRRAKRDYEKRKRRGQRK